jgi:TetR/AcrR family transcriptional regulator
LRKTGVLFKYFEDKESLFMYVVEMALQEYVEALPVQDVTSFDDPFAWVKDATIRKIRFSKERPLGLTPVVWT